MACLLLVLALFAMGHKAGAQLNAQEQAIAGLMAQAGGQNRPSVNVDPTLSKVARARAIDMAKRNYFSHTNPDGRGPNYLVRAAGYPLPASYSANGNNIESIAAGDSTASAAWSLWMGSSAHKSHLLAQQAFYVEQTSIGVGYYFDPSSDYQHYWVVISAPPPAPSLSVVSPAAGAGLTTSQVTVAGTSAGTPAAARVVVRLENSLGVGDFEPATGTTSWNRVITGLVPGPNTVRVRTLDSAGGTIREVVRTFRQVVLSPLIVSVEGGGTAPKAFLGTTQRELGATYKVVATPSAGWLFDRWTGSIESSAATLSFVMAEGLQLTARFRVNPFYAMVNSYSGLVTAADPGHASSGLLKVTTTGAGTLSGKLSLGGKVHALVGRFDEAGDAQITIKRGVLPPLVVSLHLDLTEGTGLLTGSVTDGTFVAALSADPATPPKQVHPVAGRYTVAFQASLEDGGPEVPQGIGTAVLTVSTAGVGSLSGTLADGQTFTASANVARNGLMPVYAPLFSGTGSLAGTVRIDPETRAVTGAVHWSKPARPTSALFPAAFAIPLSATGSSYTVPVAGTPALQVSTQTDNSALRLLGGDLETGVEQAATLLPSNRIAISAPQLKKLALTIAPSTGRFTGTFTHPITRAVSTIRGVILQDRNQATGYFLSSKASGLANFAPAN